MLDKSFLLTTALPLMLAAYDIPEVRQLPEGWVHIQELRLVSQLPISIVRPLFPRTYPIGTSMGYIAHNESLNVVAMVGRGIHSLTELLMTLQVLGVSTRIESGFEDICQCIDDFDELNAIPTWYMGHSDGGACAHIWAKHYSALGDKLITAACPFVLGKEESREAVAGQLADSDIIRLVNHNDRIPDLPFGFPLPHVGKALRIDSGATTPEQAHQLKDYIKGVELAD